MKRMNCYGLLIKLLLIIVLSPNPHLLTGQTRNSVLRLCSINIRVADKKDGVNFWDCRKELMTDFIHHKEFDIICMQEVAKSQQKYIDSTLQEYVCIGDRPQVVKGEEYLPIYFKRELFECLESQTFWLSETPDSSGIKGWDGKHPRRATWVKLKHKSSGTDFVILNTHLDHAGKYARQKGMELIKLRLKTISEILPVVICGDMNCLSSSSVYYSALNDEFMMYDAYHVAKKRRGATYSYHGFGKRSVEKRNMIDYIFVTKQFKVNEIEIPFEENEKGFYLSDHCPIIVTLCLNL